MRRHAAGTLSKAMRDSAPRSELLAAAEELEPLMQAEVNTVVDMYVEQRTRILDELEQRELGALEAAYWRLRRRLAAEIASRR